MFFIWGTGKRKKVTKYAITDLCGCCGTAARMSIIKISVYFSLFFIPLFNIKSNYYVVCPSCQAAREVSKKEFKQIKEQYKMGQTAQVQEVPQAQQPVASQPAQPVQQARPVEPQTQTTNTAVASTPSAAPAEDKETVIEKMIWQDIEKVIFSLVDKSLIQDNDKFNKFLNTLRASLLRKYGDAEKVDKVINKYFDIK